MSKEQNKNYGKINSYKALECSQKGKYILPDYIDTIFSGAITI